MVTTEETKLIADWEKKQRKALGIIRRRVGDGPMAYISTMTRGVDAMDKLHIAAPLVSAAA